MKLPSGIRLKDVVSPWSLGILSASVGILSTFTPVDFYERVLGERDLMFMNFKLYALIISLSALFILFSILASKISIVKHDAYSGAITGTNMISAKVCLLLAILISFVNISTTLSTINLGDIVSSFAFGDGGGLRTSIGQAQSDARLGWTKDVASFLLLYPIWIFFKLKLNVVGFSYKFMFVIAIMLFVLMSVLTLTRGPLINFLTMTIVIFLSAKFSDKPIPLRKLLSIVLVGTISITSFFFIVASARNVKSDSSDTPIRAILGYFPASYNRAAYIVDDKLHYPNEGGFYVMQGVINPPYIGRALDVYTELRRYGLKVPRSDEEDWFFQFSSVANAGLNQAYIWATTFGWAWADVGAFSFIIFIIYGVFSGICFSLFQKNTIFGIIFYPYIVTTITQWNAGLLITQRSTILAAAVVVLIYVVTKIANQRRMNYRKMASHLYQNS